MCAITDQIESDIAPQETLLRHPASIRRPSVEKNSRQPNNEDFLAKFTYSQRQFVYAASAKWASFINSNKLRVLMGSTQPGHVVAVGLVTLVATLCYPAAFSTERPSSLTNLIYLASIAIHIGDQFWMTFISGLALYFSLPRHAFGEVQKVLFPKYFALNTFLSALTLITFARLHTHHHHFSTMQWLQLGSICTCFVTELIIRVYLVPPVIYLITEKTRIEKMEPGVGNEIGYHAPGKLAACPHYMKLHKTFRKYHLGVAMGNLLTMVCTTLQLIYIQHNYSNFLC